MDVEGRERAEFSKTQMGKVQAHFNSRVYPGKRFNMCLKRKNKDGTAKYRCKDCNEIYKKARCETRKCPAPPVYKMDAEQRWIDNPDERHFCIDSDRDLSIAKSEAKQSYR